MGLFSKNVCSLCGCEYGVLNKFKLGKGSICCSCAEKYIYPFMRDKISPDFDVKDFSQFIEYRENNKQKLQEYEVTDWFFDKISVDAVHKQMMFITEKDIKKNPDLLEFNPDVFDMKDIFVYFYYFDDAYTKSGVLSNNLYVDVKLVIGFKSPWYGIQFCDLILKKGRVRVSKITKEITSKDIVELEAFDEFMEEHVPSAVKRVKSYIQSPSMNSINPEYYDAFDGYFGAIAELKKRRMVSREYIEEIYESIKNPKLKKEIKKRYKISSFV